MAGQSDDYEVGYGKPPPANRFQKGKSGNPGGRPRGDRTLAAEVGKALDQTIRGFVNGKQKRKSVRGIIASNLAKKAAEGDLGAVALIDKIESRQVRQGISAKHVPSSFPNLDPENDQHFEVRLKLEEGPVRQPDFVDCVEMELLRRDLPPDIRAAIEELVSRKQYLMKNAASLGMDLTRFFPD